jgi:glutathione S-transferase
VYPTIAMKLELYYSPTSPYSRKVHVLLLEKGATVGLINIRESERKAKDKNPLGKVPTLLVDDVPLFDSTVLTEFIDAAFPDPPLLPKAPLDRAIARRYEALADGISDVLIPIILDRKRPAELQNGALNEAYVGKARASLQALDAASAGRHYLHGEAFSLADIAVVAALGYANLRFPELLAEGYPNLNRYHERQLERPSLKATIPPNLPPL